MTDKFFEASSINIGICKIPACRNVHIQLLDAGGVTRAHAVMACEDIEALRENLKTVRDHILAGGGSMELH